MSANTDGDECPSDCQTLEATPHDGGCSAGAQPVAPVLVMIGLVALGLRPRRRRL